MIKAAIFDMDGLLIDSEPFWEIVNKDVYGRLGIKLTEEDRSWMIGRRSNENAEFLYKKYGWEGPTAAEVTEEIIALMIKNVKSDGVLLPGVHHVLQLSKEEGLHIAIASSSPQVLIDAVVDALEIREHFHHIYSAQFEEFGKPHPGVFIKVAKHFKVDVEECVVFEDSPSGVLAAKSAKMQCVAVPMPQYKDHKFIQAADLILDSLEDFSREKLKQL